MDGTPLLHLHAPPTPLTPVVILVCMSLFSCVLYVCCCRTPWAVFVTVVSVQLVVVVVGSLVSVIGRHVCRKEVVQPSTLQRHIRGGEVALPSSSQRSNLRDVAALFNVVACVTRVLYVHDAAMQHVCRHPAVFSSSFLLIL